MNELQQSMAELLSGLLYTVNATSKGTLIRFPESAESDYHFEVSLDSEHQFFEICAVLSEARRRDFPDHDLFWYEPFEVIGSDSPDQVMRQCLETLRLLVTHDTRICQRKGLLWWSFACERFHEGHWVPVYGHTAFRYSNFHPPQIKGKRQWYQAKALKEKTEKTGKNGVRH